MSLTIPTAALPTPSAPTAPGALLADRQGSVIRVGHGTQGVACERRSTAGSVSQRACTFCGSRVVLYPIADALHLVHGPVGCASYTWDIRGALSSGPQLHRLSFTTDLREDDVIRGGERKLAAALRELIARHKPKVAFVYATCLIGVIGDDVSAVCRTLSRETGIPVLDVASEGFKGTKKDGYAAACAVLDRLIGTGDTDGIGPYAVNLLGDFNIAGESWLIRGYLERLGIQVVSVMTGDARIDEVRKAHGARLNIVQCAGSMTRLAKRMEERFRIPSEQVSFFGIEDCAEALYRISRWFDERDRAAGGNSGMLASSMLSRAKALVREEIAAIQPELARFRRDLTGRSAALYVGGAFKAFSLVRALRQLGMRVVMAGTQTGGPEEYQHLADICDPGTIIADDSNPLELAAFLAEQPVDVFIGGVKERPIAYKLGIGFCDHNHERKIGLAGFEGMVSFAREIHATCCSPIWKLVRGHDALADGGGDLDAPSRSEGVPS